MKVLAIALTASLVANACVVALLVAGARSPAASGGQRTDRSADFSSRSVSPVDVWNELQTSDLAAQVVRLRAEDFPPAMIRSIIASQIRERFAARRKALDDANADAPYWLPTETNDPKKQSELRALAREERKALTDLLGPDLQNGTTLSLRRLLPNIADDKIAQLAEIRDRYDEKRTELYANNRGSILIEEMAKIDALEKAMRAEFGAVLTPEEFEDYNLRSSRTAMQLRSNLAAFDATEQEFRALFKLQSNFDDQFGIFRGLASPEQMRARSDAQRELTNQVKATLAENRYADYQRATDYSYRQTSQLVARLDLPPQTAAEIYAIQQEIQQKIAEVGRTPANPTERMTQRSALAAEAESKLTAKLGASGYEAYKQYGGTWLQRLIPPAQP